MSARHGVAPADVLETGGPERVRHGGGLHLGVLHDEESPGAQQPHGRGQGRPGQLETVLPAPVQGEVRVVLPGLRLARDRRKPVQVDARPGQQRSGRSSSPNPPPRTLSRPSSSTTTTRVSGVTPEG